MIATRSTFILLSVGVVIFALTQWWPYLRIIGAVYDIAILLLLIADYQLTPRPHLVSAIRDIAERLSIGRENPVTLQIYNSGALSLHCLVRDDIPGELKADVQFFEFDAPENGVTTLNYSVTPQRRGAYEFKNINIRYRSFLGLFWRQVRIPAGRKVKVFSDLKALYELSIKLSRSSELGELHQRKRGQGTDFASLKEYTVGDDATTIDWKATARRERPVVRTYEAEQEQRLVILIDAGRMMASDLEGLTRFDHALNAALCLALTGLSHNDQVGMGVFADKALMYLPPRRGKVYLKNILEASFEIGPRMIEPDYVAMLSYFASMQKGRSLMAVLTDLTDPTGSQALLTGLAGLAPRHLPFCITLKDRQIINIANTTTAGANERNASISDIYQRAIATELINQREVALSVLQRRGCLVLDVPPQELSNRLVDCYLEVKSRARL